MHGKQKRQPHGCSTPTWPIGALRPSNASQQTRLHTRAGRYVRSLTAVLPASRRCFVLAFGRLVVVCGLIAATASSLSSFAVAPAMQRAQKLPHVRLANWAASVPMSSALDAMQHYLSDFWELIRIFGRMNPRARVHKQD
jgi:hypothetical protein